MSGWSGLDEANAEFDALPEAMAEATPLAIDAVMDRLVRQTKTNLSLGQHAPETWTGSAPGSPPWRVSGKLRRSIRKDRATRVSAYRWSGQAGASRATAYGRIQELGGTIYARGGKKLRWVIGGRAHFASSVELPARPYLRPAWEVVKITTPRQFKSRWQAATRSVLK